jgi:hypothetical protein
MTRSVITRTLARSCKELRVLSHPKHPLAGIFREMRRQFAEPVMRQDYPEFNYVLDLNHPLEAHPELRLQFRNTQQASYAVEDLDSFDVVLKHINYLETSADRAQYLKRHKDIWWRFDSVAETLHVAPMVEARETDENKEEVA